MLRSLLIALPLVAGLPAQDFGIRIDKLAAEQRFSGSILVARDGKTLHSKGYGLANRVWGMANTPRTRFQIASITKTFTALAMLQLVEQGKCKLNDRAAAYLPNAPAAWKDITIEHLSRHRSGIPPHQKPTEYQKTITQPYTPAELVAEYYAVPLSFPPGTKFQYSNAGYQVLGLIIENISGQTYRDYVRKHILDPAAMKDTDVWRYQEIVPELAEGYETEGGQVQRAPYWDSSVAFAAGNMYSTTEDLLRSDEALASGKLLGHALTDAMYSTPEGSMGLGWFVRSSKSGVRFYEHTGTNPGFASILRHHPESRLLVVILSNDEDTDTTGLANSVERVFLP
jgi:CubicO group peptidase (beta-lactamase class C family)